MGTIRIHIKLILIGITLLFLTLTFFLKALPSKGPSGNSSSVPFEFTDVRIGTVGASQTSPLRTNPLVEQVTIDPDFTSPPAWCQWTSPDQSDCPFPLSKTDQARAQEHLQTHWGIPLL